MKKGNFLLTDKPAGWTSFDVVNYIRKAERIKSGNKNIRVGHAGTLDPFATGLLIIGVGREATRRLDEFKNLPKTYLATVRLGETSDTDDPTGIITKSESINSKTIPDLKKIKTILQKFIGEQKQIPPMYSAKKIGGRRLYKIARAGKTIERQPQKITIIKIKFAGYKWPDLKLEIACSTGTYIRTLARDIGAALGTGGYCLELRRTKIGKYNVKKSVEIAGFDKMEKLC